jgi:predicted dinucleotide-binding enzyme
VVTAAPRTRAGAPTDDDDDAATTIKRLIRAAGVDPLKAGGIADAGQIEGPGANLHQFSLNGEVVDREQTRALVAAAEPASHLQ